MEGRTLSARRGLRQPFTARVDANIDPYKQRYPFIVPKIRRKSNYFFTK